MKKCSHGDLVPVTLDSIRKGASENIERSGNLKAYYQSIGVLSGNIKMEFICNRILLSKLIRTMTEIK